MIKYLLTITVVTLLAAACTQDYVDKPAPTDAVDTITPFQSVSGAEAVITGIYSYMRDATGGSGTGHNRYGIKSHHLAFEAMSNYYILPSTWFIYEYQWDYRQANWTRTRSFWGLNYRVIANVNTLIEGVQTSGALGDSEKNALIAEARAIRALCYFNLARIYQYTYTKDPSAAGVPLQLEVATGGDVKGKARAPLSEVFTAIVDDLTFATNALTSSRNDKYRINREVAQGIFARVLLEMGTWQQAHDMAAAARGAYPLMSGADYTAGFSDISNDEWIWGLPVNTEQSNIYASFFSHTDHSRDGYHGFYNTPTFVAEFSASDVRNQFTGAGVDVNGDGSQEYASSKFVAQEDNFTGDLLMMRAAEMVLIEAEALAEMGSLTPAKERLFELQSQRDPSATMSMAATKAELIDEILLERQKELYGELGIGFFDLKRRQLPLVRNSDHYVTGSVLGSYVTNNSPLEIVIPPDVIDWNFKIPQVEIDANEYISEADQNP